MSKSKRPERLFGEERFVTTVYGDVMECIKYKDALHCTFQFIDEYGYTVDCQWSQAEKKKNPCKAPFEKTLCGVACVGKLSNGEIPKPSSNVEIRVLYRRYMNMLNRCYNSDGTVIVRDNGTIVTVHEDWLNFSTFVEDMRKKENYKEWQESGYSSEYEFDKDINCFLGHDTTKIVVRQYSNETVRIVKKKVNLVFRRVTSPFYGYKTKTGTVVKEPTSVLFYPTGTDLENVHESDIERNIDTGRQICEEWTKREGFKERQEKRIQKLKEMFKEREE